ncbi:MAG: DUF1801 domain-containing protein [Candidatus Micrarchaeota archaeon]|nr:DUF1801 domain-containing protein [Candidatus Micrarchaeota archaeon]
MADKKPNQNNSKKTMPKSPQKAKGFTKDEIAAMKEYLQEKNSTNTDGESTVLEKISLMSEPDRTIARRVHQIIKSNAPSLSPKTWYGMPAYTRDDKVVCFFQPAEKFKARYATLGFSDKANLDDGAMWATSFALRKLGPAEEAKIAALVKKAIG